MDASAAATALAAPPRTETYGLPEQCPHLIAKLRLVDPAILAAITHPKAAA
jgi:hypothetical protein